MYMYMVNLWVTDNPTDSSLCPFSSKCHISVWIHNAVFKISKETALEISIVRCMICLKLDIFNARQLHNITKHL